MRKASPLPITQEDQKINYLVKKFKKNLDSILVSPFNYKNWNRI